MESFHGRVIELIKKIPRGKVATYGQIAALAGNHRAARQVARVLHSSSRKEGLPWHRVVNARGRVSLPPGAGFELQREMLAAEGIAFSPDGGIDLSRYGWKPQLTRSYSVNLFEEGQSFIRSYEKEDTKLRKRMKHSKEKKK